MASEARSMSEYWNLSLDRGHLPSGRIEAPRVDQADPCAGAPVAFRVGVGTAPP